MRMHRRLNVVLAIAATVLPACRDGEPTAPMDGAPAAAVEAEAAVAPPFLQISAGNTHSCGVTTANLAYCWGMNTFGNLGDGTAATRLAPAAVAGGLLFADVRAGVTHSCGLTTGGRAYCWGQNDVGQLGNGTIPAGSGTPVAVAGNRRFIQLRVGFRHTCALTAAGAAFCWGRNATGELGTGSNSGPETCDGLACSTRPVRVAGGHVFRQVRAGGEHSCGLTEDRLAWCWGNNPFGQLGDGTVAARIKPVMVLGNHRFQQFSAGGMHTCGVDREHRAWCWGRNEVGQVGDASTLVRRRRPVAVAGGLAFGGVSAGTEHSCGTTTTDAVYCWGGNRFGQIGDGTGTDRFAPVKVTTTRTWKSVVAGWMHTCGITSADRAYCWGELTGDGTFEQRRTPVPVAPPS